MNINRLDQCYVPARAFSLYSAILTGAALGQSGANEPPSKTELTELLNKASDKVEGFEEAIKLVKPDLDKIDAKLATNYLDAASTARLLIKAVKVKDATAYSPVGLLATLDDLSLDAEEGGCL